MLSLIPEESLIRLKQRFGKRFALFNAQEIQALVTADLEGYVDNARMRQITNLHAADVTTILQDLVSQEVLFQEGQGRWSRYNLRSVDGPRHNAPSSLHNDEDSPHTGSASSHKEKSYSLYRGEIPQDKWDMLIELAEPARVKKRLPPKEMEKLILSLCKDNWLTNRQLSLLPRRNSEGLQTRFITQMVSHNLLKLRYPDKPNRSDQAYSAV